MPRQSCPFEESSATSTLVAASNPAAKTASVTVVSSDSEEVNGNHRGSSLRLVRSRVKSFLSGSFGRGEGRKKKRRKRPDIQDRTLRLSSFALTIFKSFSRI